VPGRGIIGRIVDDRIQVGVEIDHGRIRTNIPDGDHVGRTTHLGISDIAGADVSPHSEGRLTTLFKPQSL